MCMPLFFGYSDNTNMHLLLWNLGLVSDHGGSIMVQLGRGGAMHPYTVAPLRRALFERGQFALYHPKALVVFNMDFGHTDPQFVVTYPFTPG